MDQSPYYNIPDTKDTDKGKSGIQINFKRVVNRAIQYWYIVALSVIASLSIAFLVNRYSSRIYPVKASLIIRESDENAGAKFLYNNELLSPSRNFFNELYIMKSYPLLEEVVTGLGFDVSFHQEGDIKTTEYYNSNLPIEFEILPTGKKPYGNSLYLKIVDDNTFSLQYVTNPEEKGKNFPSLKFNDTIRVNGFRFYVTKKRKLDELRNKTLIVRFNDPLSLAKSYSNRLKVKWASPGAAVVDLEVNGSIKEKEIDFLNRFIERYQHYDIESKNKMSARAIAFLDEQLVIIGDSLRHYEDQVEAFKKRNIITSLSEETARLYTRLQELENQKFNYKLTDNYFTYITDLLNRKQYDGIFTPSSVGITDNVIANLISELIQQQSEINLYRSNINKGVGQTQNNPILQAKLTKIEYIKSDILKTIENTRTTKGINIQFINDQIKLVETRLAKLPRTERELVGIQRNYSLRENLYIFLLQKRTEAGLSMASTTSDIVIVNPPLAGGPISPQFMQNYIAGISIGLLLPVLVFVLLELLNNRIQSKEDIEVHTSVPLIGGVGHNPAAAQLIVYNKPRSAMAESFRALRSNLNYFTGNKEKQIFMVTSSIPGEGKSFTALNLATVYALAGKRIVLVGADLRKPKLFDELGLTNNVGLSQYLSNMASLEQILQVSKIENLSFISAGPMPPNPSELLLKIDMELLLNQLREKFDFVIIDTPPLSFVTDAFVLSKFVNHTLFVVRQDYTPREALNALNEYYTTGKLINISLLFNDLQKSGLGYGYGSSGYGYAYGYGYGTRKKKNDSGYYYE